MDATRTFVFESDAEGLVDGGLSSMSFGYYASDGSDALGCVRFTHTSPFGGTATESGGHSSDVTWEDLGIPAGATVTDVQVAVATKAAVFPVSYSRTLTVDIKSSGAPIASSPLLFIDADIEDPLYTWATQYGTKLSVDSGYSASTTPIRLSIVLSVTLSPGSSFDFRLDDLAVTIWYTVPPSGGGGTHDVLPALAACSCIGPQHEARRQFVVEPADAQAEIYEASIRSGSIRRTTVLSTGSTTTTGSGTGDDETDGGSGEIITDDGTGSGNIKFEWSNDHETWLSRTVASGTNACACMYGDEFIVAYNVTDGSLPKVQIKRTRNPAVWPSSAETPRYTNGDPIYFPVIAIGSLDNGLLAMCIEAYEDILISRDGGETWAFPEGGAFALAGAESILGFGQTFYCPGTKTQPMRYRLAISHDGFKVITSNFT